MSYPQILFALNNFYMCTLFTMQKLPEAAEALPWPRSWGQTYRACPQLLC